MKKNIKIYLTTNQQEKKKIIASIKFEEKTTGDIAILDEFYCPGDRQPIEIW